MQIFADDTAELARAIARSGERVAASEVAQAQPEARTPRLRERIAAKALELARRFRSERLEREPQDGERAGIAVRGWPRREPELEPGR